MWSQSSLSVSQVLSVSLPSRSVGVGSPAGEPVPLPDGSYLRDAAGKAVISHLDEAMLQKIAAAGGQTEAIA